MSKQTIPIVDPLDGIVKETDLEFEADCEHHERIYSNCIDQLVKCFSGIREQLGPYEARHMVEELLKTPLSELPRKEHHRDNDSRNEAFVAEYKAAPKGQRESVIARFAEEHGMTYLGARGIIDRNRQRDIGHLFKKHLAKLK